MSLEVLNTLGTLTTVAIVAAAAIAALIQLRHLRAGNQINAMLSIGDQFDRQAFRDALYLVIHKLQSALQDPAYRDYHVALARGLTPPEVSTDHVEVHRAATLIGNTYEELGILVKNGIVDRNLFQDRYSAVIIREWNRLQYATALARAAAGRDSIWENFELLTVMAQDWKKQYPSGTYPKGVRRLQVPNPWPVAPAPAR